MLPVRGIGFSFFTPEKHPGDLDYTIPLDERDLIVGELLRLRRDYGEKVGFTPAMARTAASRRGYTRWNNRSLCPVTKRVRCFKSNGEPKACTYGDEADCSRCGCAAVVAYRGAFRPFDLRTLGVILGLLIPQGRVRENHREVGVDHGADWARAVWRAELVTKKRATRGST